LPNLSPAVANEDATDGVLRELAEESGVVSVDLIAQFGRWVKFAAPAPTRREQRSATSGSSSCFTDLGTPDLVDTFRTTEWC
jgi:hypothetical protein